MDLSLRWAAVGGSAAFVFSVLFGMFGGVGFATLLIRAVIGAVVFAAAGVGCRLVISHFLPELLETTPADAQDKSTGEAIDILIEDDQEAEYGEDDELSEMVEEVEELSGEDVRTFSPLQERRAEPVDSVEDVDTLPDVGMLSDAFSGTAGGGEESHPGDSREHGDKNPEVLARVVQTLLKRDQKG